MSGNFRSFPPKFDGMQRIPTFSGNLHGGENYFHRKLWQLVGYHRKFTNGIYARLIHVIAELQRYELCIFHPKRRLEITLALCTEMVKYRLTTVGNPTTIMIMPTLTQKQRLTVVEDYDVAADAKKRISLRSAKTKYFHVKALSNGCFLLEPRVLVSPQAISARSLKMLDKSVANLKKGLASAPINLSAFVEA
jgi:hypothetical protein